MFGSAWRFAEACGADGEERARINAPGFRADSAGTLVVAVVMGGAAFAVDSGRLPKFMASLESRPSKTVDQRMLQTHPVRRAHTLSLQVLHPLGDLHRPNFQLLQPALPWSLRIGHGK